MQKKIITAIVFVIASVFFNIASSLALGETDSTSEEYLINHGHSQEAIRLINLQRKRVEGNTDIKVENNSFFKKFLKNLWFEKDASLYNADFGHRKIKTAETKKFYFEKDTNAAIIDQECKKTPESKVEVEPEADTETNEILINDIKIRE